jgi:hypothetical protein
VEVQTPKDSLDLERKCTRPVFLNVLHRLEEETAWIERHRQLWEARFDELDKVVDELKRKEKINGRKKRK